jgi:hypothetical protein
MIDCGKGEGLMEIALRRGALADQAVAILVSRL